MAEHATTISEYGFEPYQQRQKRYVTEEQLKLSLDRLRYGNRFRYESGQWTPESYPGFAIVSMVESNPGNESLMPRLEYYRSRLEHRLGNPGICFMLPLSSYHQTIANTLSADRYKRYIVENGILEEYPHRIQRVFDEAPHVPLQHPIRMRLIGFSVFGSSMGLLGIFEERTEYQAIQNLRDFIYTHPILNEIDIRRTRPFIGHITYAYFGPEAENSKAHIFEVLSELNKEIEREDLLFTIQHTQLRYYNNLSQFQIRSDYPTYHFYTDKHGI